MRGKIFVSFLAIIANLALAVGKLFVGFISGSGAVFADGINSGTDVVSSFISYVGIKVAEKPADKGHPYGHEKAEVISGFVITLIIFVSALFILYEAVRELINPSPMTILALPLIVMGISAGVNGIMSYLKISFGKKYNSVSLISDGIHSRIDLLVSATIFLGLFFVNYFSRLDAILALFVGLYILKESFSLGKETTDSLMGASAGEEIEKEIRKIIKEDKIEITSLKTQKLGEKVFAEIRVKLPSKLKVEEASKLIENLERKLTKKISKLNYISIQIESHDVGIGYYKPGLGEGFGWRKARFKDEIKEAEGKGPEGYCICEKCGYKVKHERGVPCSSIKCPKCKINLKRN